MPSSQSTLAHVLATLDVSVQGGRQTACGPSWASSEREWADPFGRLYWPRSGSGWTEHHGQHYQLRPGVLSLIPAQTTARYHCPEAMELDWLHFNATVLHGLDLFACLTVPYEIPIADIAWMDRLWDDFLVSQQAGSLGTPVAVEGFVRLLLALFIDRYTADKDDVLRGIGQFNAVLAYIETHLSERLTLARLAEVAHLHPGYFSTRFSQVMGKGPTAYINQRRVELAKRLLRETTDTQHAIAVAVGCGDAYYFSRLFKHLTGMSPGEYRRFSALRHP